MTPKPCIHRAQGNKETQQMKLGDATWQLTSSPVMGVDRVEGELTSFSLQRVSTSTTAHSAVIGNNIYHRVGKNW